MHVSDEGGACTDAATKYMAGVSAVWLSGPNRGFPFMTARSISFLGCFLPKYFWGRKSDRPARVPVTIKFTGHRTLVALSGSKIEYQVAQRRASETTIKLRTKIDRGFYKQ